MLQNNELSVQQMIDQLNLRLVRDRDVLMGLIKSILDEYPEELNKFKVGKKNLFGFFMGEIMRKSRSIYDPKLVKSELKKMLKD